MTSNICPACSSTLNMHETQGYEYGVCPCCNGIIAENMPDPIVAQFVDLTDMDASNVPSDHLRYFDFVINRPGNKSRVHGWFNVVNKKVTQFG